MLTSLTLTRERDERESLNASKRIAVRAKSAAFADLKVQSRAYFNERRRLLSLADSVRARDGSSSEAWVELMPLLLNRIDGKSIIASRNAGRLLRELSSIASSHTAPCVPYLTFAIVSPPINFSRPIRVFSLFDGYSGFLIALLEALAGSLLDVDVVHAADSMQSKVNLAAAVASPLWGASAPPDPPGLDRYYLPSADFGPNIYLPFYTLCQPPKLRGPTKSLDGWVRGIFGKHQTDFTTWSAGQ